MKLALAVCMALLAVIVVQAKDKVAPPSLPAGSRVANGRPAAPRQFPYMAYIEALYDSGSVRSRCAGSLITRSAVLTVVPDCVWRAVKWRVRLGSINHTGEDPNVWTVESILAMIHPQFNSKSFDNSIAIIHLPRLAPLNEFIQLVHLPSSPVVSSYIGRQAIVSGWGYPHYGSYLSDVLRWAQVVVIPNGYCKTFAPSYWAITDRQLCATSDTRTAYYNDFGAPLVLYTGGRYIQIGIFFGDTDSNLYNTTAPDVYIRVTSFIDWIKLNTESD